jgi:hypothetical protein
MRKSAGFNLRRPVPPATTIHWPLVKTPFSPATEHRKHQLPSNKNTNNPFHLSYAHLGGQEPLYLSQQGVVNFVFAQQSVGR